MAGLFESLCPGAAGRRPACSPDLICAIFGAGKRDISEHSDVRLHPPSALFVKEVANRTIEHPTSERSGLVFSSYDISRQFVEVEINAATNAAEICRRIVQDFRYFRNRLCRGQRLCNLRFVQ